MKQFLLFLFTLTLVLGCNGAKKEAAYECSGFLDQAYEAFSDANYEIRQARSSRDWNSTRSHLQRAMSYSRDAEGYLEMAANIASVYDSEVVGYSKQGIQYARDTYNYANQAYSSTSNTFVEGQTTECQRSITSGERAVINAKNYLWY